MNPKEDNMQLPAVQSSPTDQPDLADGVIPSAQPQAAPFDPQLQQLQQSSSQQQTTPPVAEDVDLIEKAWVEKAKDIVKGTMGDPHAQSAEINKIKADYIKKRYNKDIRSEE